MKGKRFKKKEKSVSSIIVFILFIFFISLFIFSSLKIFRWLRENKERNEIINDIKETVTIDEKKDDVKKFNVDFKTLKKKNPDTIAWIKVNGTDIEFPVVKTDNNEYYLNHIFDKSYNTSGWVFMDYKNKGDGTDENMVIYGHNRRDGSIFATLKNILTSEWQNNEDNYIIPFITEKKKEEYQVFSVYKIENEDYYITTNFRTKNEFQNFIDKIKSRSEKDFSVKVNAEDNILTLSTCADNKKYRIVLHAKKIK